MRKPISLKSEREVLIQALQELASVKHHLCDIAESKGDVANLYGGRFLDIEMELGTICGDIGAMIGYTICSDICEGLEVNP